MSVNSRFTMRKSVYAEIIKLEVSARLTKKGRFPWHKRQNCEQKYKIFVYLWTNNHHEDTILESESLW